jgi:hypothetical protein
VYLYNPTRKPGQSYKFLSLWQGPYKVTVRLSKLNYRVENEQGKEFVVHINRMKRAFKQGNWKSKERERCYKKRRTRQPEQEDEEVVLDPSTSERKPTTGTQNSKP